MAIMSGKWLSLLAFLLAVCTLFTPSLTVKHETFKTCAQSGFCTRNRAYADTAATHGAAWTSPFKLDPSSIHFAKSVLTATILKTSGGANGLSVRLPLTITFLESGAARVTVDEERRQKGEVELRHGSQICKHRYNEAAKWAIVGGLEVAKVTKVSREEGHQARTKVVFGKDGKHEAIVTHNPFGVEFRRDGDAHVVLNERGLLNVEPWRPKIEREKKESGREDQKDGEVVEEQAFEDEVDESTWWEESFGGSTDSKPRGPESVALDLTFPGYEHVFGLPEHTGPMSLKETRGGENKFDEPYRLYNLDVFEYIIDSPMALYGAIPYMQAHKKDSTVGVFWLNAAETWVDIVKRRVSSNPISLGIGDKIDTQTHWFSESGILDVFILLGPTPKDISKTYGELTGYTQIPQQFATAYHQCRWNYVTDEDVKDVDRKFDRHNIPYDVIWLDIEYTDGKKYFTWDPLTFPDPLAMQKQLDTHSRKLVTIIDPHIKKENDYLIIDELQSKNLAVVNKDVNQYEGWCWPGASYWPDTFNPATITWWKSLFKYDKFKGTSPIVFIWNDMNEPSVFNGPETTMPKDNIHHGGWEHRDVHNLNGLTFHNATFHAMLERDGKKPSQQKRPFILTRSFFAGSQRLGATWTGDNQADWPHLAAALPMILSLGTSGFPFAGADVGGFFGNPSKELLTRWYQAGAFYPFFRGHAHIDTRRREPYLAGEPYQAIITQALRLRYQLLPAWYTAFHTASIAGEPIVRPNWYVHPSDDKGFAVEDQMYLGSTGLLVKPVTAEGGTSVDFYLADPQTYFDYFDYTVYAGGAGRTQKVPAPLDKVPLLMQGGRIFPRRERPRRSSGAMKWDPFTLVVVLGREAQAQARAQGELYFDDGESYEYLEGAYIHRHFSFGTDGEGRVRLRSDAAASASTGPKTAAYLKRVVDVRVEKIVVVNAPAEWRGKRTVRVSEEVGVAVAVAVAGGKKKDPPRPTTTRDVELVFEPASGGKAAWAVVRRPDVGIGTTWEVDFS